MSFNIHSDIVSVELRSVAGTSLTGSLAAVGSATTVQGRLIVIANEVDVDVVVSLNDSSNDQLVIPTGDMLQLDLKSNGVHMKPGSTVYARELSSASSGTLYISIVGA